MLKNIIYAHPKGYLKMHYLKRMEIFYQPNVPCNLRTLKREKKEEIEWDNLTDITTVMH